jgi:hypothetical protein
MKLEQRLNVQVGDTIAVCKEERFILLKPAIKPFKTSAGLGVQTGVHQVHFPVGLMAVFVNRCSATFQVNGEVVVDGVEA